MDTVDHFLREHKGLYAIDVVKCVLLLWLQQDNDIESFDYMKIDAELARIEQEFLEREKAKLQATKKDVELSSNAISSNVEGTHQ